MWGPVDITPLRMSLVYYLDLSYLMCMCNSEPINLSIMRDLRRQWRAMFIGSDGVCYPGTVAAKYDVGCNGAGEQNPGEFHKHQAPPEWNRLKSVPPYWPPRCGEAEPANPRRVSSRVYFDAYN